MVDVYLSPSNQENNLGLGGYGTEEQRMNLVADVVEYELQRHGLTTARNTPDMTLAQIVNQSNSLSPKAHVAIHSNASNDGTARGSQVYVHKLGGKSAQLGRSINKYVSAYTPTTDFGVIQSAPLFNGQGLYEPRRTKGAATLVETVFHDNPADAQYVIDNTYELGVALSKGILEYFKRPYRADTQENINFLKNKYNGKTF